MYTNNKISITNHIQVFLEEFSIGRQQTTFGLKFLHLGIYIFSEWNRPHFVDCIFIIVDWKFSHFWHEIFCAFKSNLPLPNPFISVRKLSMPRWPSASWPSPPTKRSPSSRPSYVWSDKSISIPRWTPFGMLYDTKPSVFATIWINKWSENAINWKSRQSFEMIRK